MVKKEFTNPINNEKVELDECKLSKSIEDYEGRAERIPNVDKNYVDLGIQFKLYIFIASNKAFLVSRLWCFCRSTINFNDSLRIT